MDEVLMIQTVTQQRMEELVFAIVTIDGFTRAGRARPDVEMVAALSEYYDLAAQSLRSSEGRIVKVIGDGILVVFPLSRARDAVAALRGFQSSATALWSAIDVACRAQVKVGVGALVTGPLGPPGDERFDVYGNALNQLFKAPTAAFFITPELRALVG